MNTSLIEHKQKSPETILAEETAKKLRLEKSVTAQLTRLFNEIGRETRMFYMATGTLLNMREFEDELRIILRQHSRRVSRQFINTLRRQLEVGPLAERSPEVLAALKSSQLSAEIQAAVTATLGRRVNQSAREITATNTERMRNVLATSTAQALLAQPTGTPTDAVIAANIQREWKRLTPGRVTTIAMTETESMAEETKAQEARVIEQENIPGLTIVKMWITVGDERVRTGRFDHVSADRQIRQLDEPFIVSGERLNFPKDTSLGASLGNVINCRCIAVRFEQEVARSQELLR